MYLGKTYRMSLREIAEQVWEVPEWYPGLGRIMADMASALGQAESDAQKRYREWVKNKPEGLADRASRVDAVDRDQD